MTELISCIHLIVFWGYFKHPRCLDALEEDENWASKAGWGVPTLTISTSHWLFLDSPRIQEIQSGLRKALGRSPWEYGLRC